ncbi:MAG: phenylalanine--tRNA ligase beta subunit [Rhodomicrobium sp.]|nr:MAG: phenylalanine--tRNA ligase beta subunit [Rhodomicrobium sp.]
MKFTLSWLKDHLETEASLEEILAKLTLIGLEVEDVINPAETLANFTIAHIEKADPHPDADKLQVCAVNNGKETLQVVCGAPNARAGLLGVFAPVGTYVPGIDFTLTKAKIRGVESYGMMCSESELELSEDHEGIIDLDETAASHIGKSYIEFAGLDDPIIDIYITPNRPDCLGVRGVARDLAAAGLGKLKPADEGYDQKGDFKSPLNIGLEFDDETSHICPAFWGRYIKGVTNGPSPEWLQQRLRAIGLRPINALVDITNYISFDRGRPLHVYDADKVSGTIIARPGKSGESFLALDGKDYDDLEGACVIADDKNPLGLGGILGGELSGSTEDTKNVLIESAYFDPIQIAMTGRKHGIISDARYRFERGIDPQSVETGVNLATKMIIDLCGGKASELIKAGEPPKGTKEIPFDPQRVTRLTGVKLSNQQVTKTLEDLGFTCNDTGKGDQITVTSPSWRPDIDGPADLVEEVIRIIGLDKVTPTPLSRPFGIARPVLTGKQKRVRLAKRALAARGAVEAITWSFIKSDEAALFGGGSPELKLANPISSDMSDMRPSLLPGLIPAAGRNIARGTNDPVLMEVGEVYHSDEADGQSVNAAIIRVGSGSHQGASRHWSGNGAKVTVFDAKADAIALLDALGQDANRFQFTTDAPAWFHPGRSAVIRLGPKITIGVFGEIHPTILKQLDVKGPIVAAEINLDALPEAKKKSTSKGAMELNDLQPVKRDFAFIVSSDTKAGDVIRAASSADKKMITNITLFDVFAGESLGEDKKSLAIEATLQPKTKTMTDEEIDAIADKIIAAVKKATGGEIRS